MPDDKPQDVLSLASQGPGNGMQPPAPGPGGQPGGPGGDPVMMVKGAIDQLVKAATALPQLKPLVQEFLSKLQQLGKGGAAPGGAPPGAPPPPPIGGGAPPAGPQG